MKKTMIRAVSVLMLLCMLAATFVGCGKEEENPAGADTGTVSTDTENAEADLYDENGYLKDSLPETYDFKGVDYDIFTWSNQKSWEWVDLEKTDEKPTNISQALRERQLSVQDRFNVKIKLTYEAGDWSNRNNFIDKLYASVSAGDGVYDLVGQYTPTAGIGANKQMYLDLNTVKNLDLEKPWWPSSIRDTASVGTKLYFVTGDITPTLIRNVHCMYVNTELYDSLGLDDEMGGRSIYQVVKDYDWTYENFIKLGIDTVEAGGNTIGIELGNNVSADAFFYGAGFMLVENTNGIMTLSKDLNNQRLMDFYEKVQKLYTGSAGGSTAVRDGSAKKFSFKEGKAVFLTAGIADAQIFTQDATDLKFSVLPMPMLTKDQGVYHTIANFWVTMYSVPVDAKDTFMSGMVLEGLGSYSYRKLSDTVYYDIFQSRYMASENADSAGMFDLVSKSVVFDSGRFFADQLGMFSVFRDGVNSTADSWTNIFGNNSGNWKTKIDGLYSKIG